MAVVVEEAAFSPEEEAVEGNVRVLVPLIGRVVELESERQSSCVISLSLSLILGSTAEIFVVGSAFAVVQLGPCIQLLSFAGWSLLLGRDCGCECV